MASPVVYVRMGSCIIPALRMTFRKLSVSESNLQNRIIEKRIPLESSRSGPPTRPTIELPSVQV